MLPKSYTHKFIHRKNFYLDSIRNYEKNVSRPHTKYVWGYHFVRISNVNCYNDSYNFSHTQLKFSNENSKCCVQRRIFIGGLLSWVNFNGHLKSTILIQSKLYLLLVSFAYPKNNLLGTRLDFFVLICIQYKQNQFHIRRCNESKSHTIASQRPGLNISFSDETEIKIVYKYLNLTLWCDHFLQFLEREWHYWTINNILFNSTITDHLHEFTSFLYNFFSLIDMHIWWVLSTTKTRLVFFFFSCSRSLGFKCVTKSN